MQYDLAVFDLDGTILDTLADLAGSVNHALATVGCPPRTVEEVRSFIGDGIRNLIARSMPEDASPASADAAFAAFKVHYAAHCADATRPYDGVMDMLTALRDAGMTLAVLSNKADPLVQTLCGKYFPGIFTVTAGERPGIPRKPAPEAVESAVGRLGFPRERTVYIGDSDVDYRTAENAGFGCVLVDWGFRSRELLLSTGAPAVVSTVAELTEALIP